MSSPSEKLRVLVVDDVTSARRIVVRVLGELGFNNVAEAKSGSDAFQKISEEQFNLVISDWEMPDTTGLDLLKKVRANDKYQGLPFIMLTSASEGDRVKEALGAGVTDYIIKPVSLQTLSDKIRRVLAANLPSS